MHGGVGFQKFRPPGGGGTSRAHYCHLATAHLNCSDRREAYRALGLLDLKKDKDLVISPTCTSLLSYQQYFETIN